eukprot:11981596-Prorocentrum_lima.AAC.1
MAPRLVPEQVLPPDLHAQGPWTPSFIGVIQHDNARLLDASVRDCGEHLSLIHISEPTRLDVI